MEAACTAITKLHIKNNAVNILFEPLKFFNIVNNLQAWIVEAMLLARKFNKTHSCFTELSPWFSIALHLSQHAPRVANFLHQCIF
jgi:hypothetical protein